MGISDLPVEVLIHIFVRLPLESLGQLKIVSKSWNALISSNRFINSHLNQSCIVQKPNVFVDECYQMRMVEFSITGEIMDVNQVFEIKLKPIHCLSESLNEPLILQIVGSANGLLCLLLEPKHSDDYVFSLCNPVTKSTWDLPGDQWKGHFSEEESLVGFWYDDVNDDYKVVIMNLVLKKAGIHEYECDVYSLRSNSWSKVRSYLDFSFDYRVSTTACVSGSYAGVLVNYALHWILSDNRFKSIFILAFDLRTYKFNILPLPEDLGMIDRLRLTVLNGSLVLSDVCQSGGMYHLWVMKDYGLNDSWMRITINKSYVENTLTPLALLEDDHKRILISYDHYGDMLQSIDLVSHQEQVIEAPCDLRDAYQVQFVGSLVKPYPPFVGCENASP